MFLKVLICIWLLLKITAGAQFTFTSTDIQTGTPFDITWTDASGPVTLLLKNGPTTNLVTVATIASGLTGTSYVWSPSTSLATGEYVLEIEDSTGPNYSEQLAISGVGASSDQLGSSATQTATLHLGGTSTGTTTAITSKTSSLSSTSPASTTSNPSTSTPATTSSSATSSSITTSLPSPSTTASTPQSATSTPQSASSTPQPHQGLSTGAKAGIGVGATLGALLFISIVAFAFWYGRRSAAKNKNSAPGEDTVRKAELEAGTAQMAEMGEALSEDEKRELERRRRAAELEGNSPVASGVISERAELEARRSGKVFEMS